jgi:hypothetical protein
MRRRGICMEFNPELTDNLRKDVTFLGISILIVLVSIAGHNLVTPDDPKKVGLVEVETNCFGVDVGACMGIQRQDHTTYNYDEYEKPEPGTENFYRLVESELMLDANGICEREDIKGMEWTSEASYQNKTADEWLENENIELLECKETYYRNITATQ